MSDYGYLLFMSTSGTILSELSVTAEAYLSNSGSRCHFILQLHQQHGDAPQHFV